MKDYHIDRKIVRILFRIPFTTFFVVKYYYKFDNTKRFFYTIAEKTLNAYGKYIWHCL